MGTASVLHLTRRILLAASCAGACAFAGGCANYRAVSEFADQTGAMTAVVKSEFTEIGTLCTQQAQVVLVVYDMSDDQALEQCAAYQRAQGRFAAITVAVLDDYAAGLAALADDKPFDLSPSVRTAGAKVAALRDGSGRAFVDAKDADAVTRIAALLVDVFASYERDRAVQRMVAATPDLTVMGESLRGFFVAPPDAPMKAPYANFVAVIAGSTASTRSILQNPQMRRAEPIRTAELLRDLRVRQKLLDRRTMTHAAGAGPTGAVDAVPASDAPVPMRIAAAIDAWLAALDRFAVDARKPDSRELIESLKRLRAATRSAKDAVDDS